MTSFNTPAILMPLDEYYVQCVEPKPKIPKRYGFHADKRQRQAARLQSYKDNSADEEDELEDEGEEPKQVDEHYSCIQDSNMDEINFDSKDFNHLCEPTDEPMDTSKGAEVLKTEIPVTSVQWRIKPNNVNRPQGAAPLVPKDAPRNQPKSQSARRYQNKQQNRRPFNLKNNNNNKRNNTHYTKNKNTSNRNNALNNRLGNNPVRNQQRGQMPTEQRLRNAYNRFNNTPTNNHSSNNNNYTNNNNYNHNNNNNYNNNNNNHNKNNNNHNNNINNKNQSKQLPQQVLMNINSHFQSARSNLNVSSSLNSNDISNSNTNSNLNVDARNNINHNHFQSYQQANVSWQSGSNSLTALINSANQNRPSFNTATQMLSNNNNTYNNNNNNNNNAYNNNNNNSYNNNNNTAARLGPRIRTISNELARSKNTYNGALGQPMNQLNIVPNKANGDIVASDSLRLADLMNMDKESCVNLNVAEVAKNAMLLLSTVFHKPILDEDVQQQLSQMQKKNGHSGEPHGLDMTIKPETTEMRMYHRFK